jgi:hypothetical protein
MKCRTILLASILILGVAYDSLSQKRRVAAQDSKNLPDLTIGKVACVDAFNVRLDVLNMGEVAAPASTATIFIYDAHNKLLERESTEVPALEPGPPVFVVFSDLGGDSGIYGKRYRVMVDSRNTIKESNETNNKSRIKIAR